MIKGRKQEAFQNKGQGCKQGIWGAFTVTTCFLPNRYRALSWGCFSDSSCLLGGEVSHSPSVNLNKRSSEHVQQEALTRVLLPKREWDGVRCKRWLISSDVAKSLLTYFYNFSWISLKWHSFSSDGWGGGASCWTSFHKAAFCAFKIKAWSMCQKQEEAKGWIWSTHDSVDVKLVSAQVWVSGAL